MTKDELSGELTLAEKEFKAKKLAAIKKYIIANNPYNVGDILEADVGYKIKVETMQYYMSENDPQVVYSGASLKKDLTPMVSGKKDSIYQSRVKQKLN